VEAEPLITAIPNTISDNCANDSHSCQSYTLIEATVAWVHVWTGMWGLWWTKRHWGSVSLSTLVSPANHSTNFSIIITQDWHNRPISGRSTEWTQLGSTPPIQIKKTIHTDCQSKYLLQSQYCYISFSYEPSAGTYCMITDTWEM
jgi:hypothetical protein